MIADSLKGNPAHVLADESIGPMPLWVRLAACVIQCQSRGRYRSANWLASHKAAAPFWGRLSPRLGGVLFRCDLRDHIMREACLTGCYEPQETALLAQMLRPGMTFVDVGANWGYFSLVASPLVGPTGRVVSVEADPRACQALRANIARNGFDFATVLELAASDRPGTLRLQEYAEGSNDSGNYGLTSTTTTQPDGRRFDVPARPLDDALEDAGIDRIDVLKMDIEGAEAPALRGLDRRLRTGRIRQILLEVHPHHLRDQGSSVEEVVGSLRRHGYALWAIDHSPATSRRVAAGRLDPRSALTPLTDSTDLGSWPHLLCSLTPSSPE